MENKIKNLTGMYILRDGDMDVIVYTYNVVNLDTGKIEQMSVQEEIQMLNSEALRRSKVAIPVEVEAINSIRDLVIENMNK